MSIRSWAIGGSVAMALTFGSATAAFAGGTPPPTPTPLSTCTPAPHGTDTPYGQPTVSPNFGYNPCPTPTPTPTPRPVCPVVIAPIPQPLAPGTDLRLCPQIRQQEFDLDINTVNPLGTVLGTGPIQFHFGRDATVNPTEDRFRSFAGSVLIHHAALGGAAVDRATCTITLDQNDVPWWIRGGGTGLDRNAVGAGLYDLRGLFSFPTRNFVCTLPVGLSAYQAAVDLNNNGSGLPAPLFFDIGVQAAGWSALQLPAVTPYAVTDSVIRHNGCDEILTYDAVRGFPRHVTVRNVCDVQTFFQGNGRHRDRTEDVTYDTQVRHGGLQFHFVSNVRDVQVRTPFTR
jgi:hypothetical protein